MYLSAFQTNTSDSPIPKQNSCFSYHARHLATTDHSTTFCGVTQDKNTGIIFDPSLFLPSASSGGHTPKRVSPTDTFSPSAMPPTLASPRHVPPGLVKSNPYSFHSSSSLLPGSFHPHNSSIEFVKEKDAFIPVLLKTFQQPPITLGEHLMAYQECKTAA